MKKTSRTKNSILNLASSLGGQLLVTVLRFVVRTIFIRTLGRSYLGINGYFSNIISMLSLTELGFDTAINFKLYKPLAEKDEKRVRVLMKFYKNAYRAVGLTIMVLGLLLIPLLPMLIKDYSRLVDIGINVPFVFILFLLQSVTSYLFFAYRSAVMKANQKKYILDVAGYGITILTNAVQLFVLIYFRDFIIYTSVIIVFNLLRNLLNAYISQRYYPQYFTKEDDKLSREEIRDLFKDCGALLVYRLNGVVLKATDNIVLGAFTGMSVVGLYSNYLLFYTTINKFANRIYGSVKAGAGNLFATESIENRYRFFKTMNYITILFYGTAAVGISVCANELIDVWIGPDYLIKQPFSILVGIEILFAGLKLNLNQIRNVTGVFRKAWTRPILSIFVNLGVSIALVQVLGIYGVIIGTISADLFTNFMVDPSIIHKYSFENYKPVSEYYKKNLLYIAQLVLVGAFDMWSCAHVFTGHGWFSVIFHIIFVGLTVPASFIAVYWRSEECQYLWAKVRRVLKEIAKKLAKNG